jgi:hypothetical protein
MYPEPSRQSFRREFIRNGRITKISGGRYGYLWSHETACGIGEDILGRIRFSLLCEIQMVLVKLAHCPHPLCDTLSYCGLELFFPCAGFPLFHSSPETDAFCTIPLVLWSELAARKIYHFASDFIGILFPLAGMTLSAVASHRHPLGPFISWDSQSSLSRCGSLQSLAPLTPQSTKSYERKNSFQPHRQTSSTLCFRAVRS